MFQKVRSKKEIDKLIAENTALKNKVKNIVDTSALGQQSAQLQIEKSLAPITQLLTEPTKRQRVVIDPVTKVETLVLDQDDNLFTFLKAVKSELEQQKVNSDNIATIIGDIRSNSGNTAQGIDALNRSMAVMGATTKEALSFQKLLAFKNGEFVDPIFDANEALLEERIGERGLLQSRLDRIEIDLRTESLTAEDEDYLEGQQIKLIDRINEIDDEIEPLKEFLGEVEDIGVGEVEDINIVESKKKSKKKSKRKVKKGIQKTTSGEDVTFDITVEDPEKSFLLNKPEPPIEITDEGQQTGTSGKKTPKRKSTRAAEQLSQGKNIPIGQSLFDVLQNEDGSWRVVKTKTGTSGKSKKVKSGAPTIISDAAIKAISSTKSQSKGYVDEINNLGVEDLRALGDFYRKNVGLVNMPNNKVKEGLISALDNAGLLTNNESENLSEYLAFVQEKEFSRSEKTANGIGQRFDGSAVGQEFRRDGIGMIAPKIKQKKYAPFKIVDDMFGNLAINAKKLIDHRLLDVQHVGTGQILAKDMPVGEDLVRLLTKRYSSKIPYDKESIKLFGQIVEGSGLPISRTSKKLSILQNPPAKPSKVKSVSGEAIFSTPDEMVARLGIISASMKAGNSSKLLRNEMSIIVDKLLDLGQVNKKEHRFLNEKYGLMH